MLLINNQNLLLDKIKIPRILFFFLALFVLIKLSFSNFLLFHSLIEFFSIVVAAIIFVIALYSYEKTDNYFLIFLGIAYGFVGSFDLLHTLAYKGMGVFKETGADLPTQLWIIARYLESISLLVAFSYIDFQRNFKLKKISLIYTFISFLILICLYFNLFPVCYQEGTGLTTFKIISEYIISLILVVCLLLLKANREYFNNHVYRLTYFAIILTILSEISFTFYISVYGVSNIIGHIFKLISFYLIYKAIIDTGLKKPYDLLFRKLDQEKKQCERIFNNVQSAIFLIDVKENYKFKYLRLNPVHEKLTGLTTEVLAGKTPVEALGKNPGQKIESNYRRCFQEKKTITYEEKLTLPAGERTWLTKLSPILFENKVDKIVGSSLDITELKQIQKQLKEKERKYRLLTENSEDIIFSINLNLKITYVNSSAEKLTGYKPQKLVNTDIANYITQESFRKVIKVFPKYVNKAKIDTDVEIPLIELKLIKKDGTRFWGELKTCFIYNYKDTPIGLQGILRDITSRKEKEERIKYLSFHDQLTDLYNRRYFAEEISRLNDSRKLPISIIIGDMDGLKYINDNYGHKIGDKFLKNATRLLTKVTRKEDVLARIGGDEFALVLPQTDATAAKKLCNRINNQLRNFKRKSRLPEPLKISLGYATMTKKEEDLNYIFNKADQRMYDNKGRRRKGLFD